MGWSGRAPASPAIETSQRCATPGPNKPFAMRQLGVPNRRYGSLASILPSQRNVRQASDSDRESRHSCRSGQIDGDHPAKTAVGGMPHSDKPNYLRRINRAAGTSLSEWSLCYQLVLTTLNQRVQGSNPCAPTTSIKPIAWNEHSPAACRAGCAYCGAPTQMTVSGPFSALAATPHEAPRSASNVAAFRLGPQ
jgi:hypothetical protein